MADGPDLSEDEVQALRRWSNVGMPGDPPRSRFIPSPEVRQGLSAIVRPTVVTVDWTLTDQDHSALLRGHEATVMEDKWNVFADGDTVHFHRSWTGFEIFRLTPQHRDARWNISTFTAETDNARYSAPTDEARSADLLAVLEFVLGLGFVRPRPTRRDL